VHPVVVQTGEQLAAAQVERILQTLLLDAALEFGDVGPHDSLAGEPDLVAVGEDVALAIGSQRAPHGRQRAAQAGAGALIEYLWPESRRDARAGMHSPVERQPAKQRAGAPARGRLDLASVELDLEIPQQ